MPRARQSRDWDRDLTAARAAEAELAAILEHDPRLEDFEDHSGGHDRLDFSFTYKDLTIHLDLKEKRQRYSAGYEKLWPEVAPDDLFIVDETVYRRIVWQGGGGYLAIHDYPGRRWLLFGPWELTLGPRFRYERLGNRGGRDFLKGKILLDLSTAGDERGEFSVGALLKVIERSIRIRDGVEAVEIPGYPIPEVGREQAPKRSKGAGPVAPEREEKASQTPDTLFS